MNDCRTKCQNSNPSSLMCTCCLIRARSIYNPLLFLLLMDYLLFPTAVTSAEPEGIPPIYSELGEPCSNSFSQSPKKHRVSGARRLTGRLNRPSLEQLPKYLSHGLTKSPGILPIGDGTQSRDQCDLADLHNQLLLQVTEWVQEEKSNRPSRVASKGRL